MTSSNSSWSSDKLRSLRNLVTWIAAGIPILVVIAVPLGWFTAGYAFETSRIRAASQLAADTISQFIYFNPKMWLFNENRLSSIMMSYTHHGVKHQLRILDQENQLIAQTGPRPAWPFIMGSADLIDGSLVVGRFEMWHSLRGLMKDSLIASVFSIPLALLIFVTLRLVPLRALDRTLKKLEESEKALKWRVTESEHALQMRVDELQKATEHLKKQRHELKKYAENATAARDAALAANRSKSEFLANMSHELRTPLNAVIGFSDMMRNELLGPMNNAQYFSYVNDIHASGKHLLGLINDILDISKIEAGEMELYEEAVCISQIITSCISLVHTRACENGVNLENHATDNLPMLMGDERKIKQIVINLLSNAVKFTPTGGKATISASLDEDGRIAILIKDTGIGIAPENIDNLLKPFTQADSTLARKYEGTGLGLPLTKALIELHQGTFVLSSALDAGTEAKVIFPAHRTVISNDPILLVEVDGRSCITP